MAKQPFQLAKIHLVAIVRRLAKGILQQFSTFNIIYIMRTNLVEAQC